MAQAMDVCTLLADIRDTLHRIERVTVGGRAYHTVYVTSTRSGDYTTDPVTNTITSPDSRGMCPFISRGFYAFGITTDIVLHVSKWGDSGPWGPIIQIPQGVPFYLPISCMAHEAVAVSALGTFQLVFISED